MSKEYCKQVGNRIFASRKNLKLSRAELGQKINLHETTVKRYEDGEIKALDVEKISEFAKALNVSPLYLMGWEDEIKKTISNSLENLPKDEKEILSLYKELDIEDRAEIRGTIKGMLKAEKYSMSKSKLHA